MSFCGFLSEPCAAMPCGSNGVCTAHAPVAPSTMATYSCACDSGFFGDNCDQGSSDAWMYTYTCTTWTCTNDYFVKVSVSKISISNTTMLLVVKKYSLLYIFVMLFCFGNVMAVWFLEPCANTPCGVNGACTGNAPVDAASNATFTCSCNDGFFGDTCEQGTNKNHSSTPS